jgi:hypothetical protein
VSDESSLPGIAGPYDQKVRDERARLLSVEPPVQDYRRDYGDEEGYDNCREVWAQGES